ncbi:MAG: GDP-mannose 4,6-dehydratase [Actinobacteria bacterium]|nr:GDP-mannose 4,6-dehydratase [Actinomycetota bacterium]
MRILVTGITGFVGGHLIECLHAIPNVEIYGSAFGATPEYFDQLNTNSNVTVIGCDLTKSDAAKRLVEIAKPDLVFHLAGIASIADTLENAEYVITNNIIGQLNLLDALKSISPKAKVLIISSGEVYGSASEDELPLSEKSDLRPNNPYSVSKLGQEFLGYQFYAAYNIPVVFARPFNHTGPRQHGNFVVPSFAKQIAEIEAGLRKPIMRVGNLQAKRDFLDVRDVVKAYWLTLNKGIPGQRYNVASGKMQSIAQILNLLLRHSKASIEVRIDPKLVRGIDTPCLLGDAGKLRELTGWQPEIPLDKTLADTLDYWRHFIKLRKGN